MARIFVSLPKSDKPRAEIITEHNKVLARVNEKLGEPVMLVESYFNENFHPLECLGESLKRMAYTDYAVFADDWENAPNCVIERKCAEIYGIPILEL